MSTMTSIRGMNAAAIAAVILPDGEVIDTSTPEGARRYKEHTLLTQLLEAGLRPFQNKDVEVYQAAKVTHTDRLADLGAWLKKPLLRDRSYSNFSLFCFAVFGLMFGLTLSLFISSASLEMYAGIIILCTLVSILVPSILYMVGGMLWSRYRGSHWQLSECDPYNLYYGTIPPDVAKIGKHAIMNCPDVILKVEHFREDPFLRAAHQKDPSVFFRIAAWDEKKFHAATM